MNDVTQKNAALVEETAASRALQGQACKRTQLVGFFRIEANWDVMDGSVV